MYICIALLCALAYRTLLARENAARARGERDEAIDGGLEVVSPELARRNGRFASVDDARREKGDAWSGYRYTL